MTLVAVPRGLIYPTADYPAALSTAGLIDATAEKIAHIGRLYWAGRPAGAKTLSTGTIQFRTGTTVFSNVATTLDIGIQGVTTTPSGTQAQPNGTYTVKTTLTAPSGIATGAGAWTTVTMTSGSANLTHGDLIAVVWDMTNKAGSDSVIVKCTTPNSQFAPTTSSMDLPITNSFVAAAWQTTVALGAGLLPNVIIVADDGTIGWIDFTIPLSVEQTTDTFADATNPDERGMMFQVPWDCKIDAVWAVCGHTDAASDFSFKMYSDPTGTPTTVSGFSTIGVLAEQGGAHAASKMRIEPLASEVSLTAGVNYGITIRATGSTNVRLVANTLGDTAHRACIPGGTTLAKITRQNDTGAFTAETPAVTMIPIGIRISQLHDTGGSAGGLVRHPGMRGGLNA